MTLRNATLAVLTVGVIQSFLIGEGIGSSAGVRWGVGIPLAVLLIVCVVGYLLSRRHDARSQ